MSLLEEMKPGSAEEALRKETRGALVASLLAPFALWTPQKAPRQLQVGRCLQWVNEDDAKGWRPALQGGT